MTGIQASRRIGAVAMLAATMWIGAPSTAHAQLTDSTFEVYGFAMVDVGHNFNTINPDWFDTMRPTKLPSYDKQYGEDHNAYAGVRQTRFGVRFSTPTDIGDLKTVFEYELFGTGVDAGQTTFRLRHAYGEIGQLGAGQYWSPFMDIDVFPNSIEYWGPTGMVFFRNVQVRWMPIKGANALTLALERPGASADQGIYADRIQLQNVKGRFPMLDLSGSYKMTRAKGYFKVAGIVRQVKWDDVLDDQFDLSGGDTGWGINLSSNLTPRQGDTIRLQYVFGEGIQNYMNDSPVDVGVQNNFQNSVTPIIGKAIPITAWLAFLDHSWNPKFSSTVGYSYQDNDNTDAQAPDSFKVGHYALGNLLYYPAPGVMVGGELQWGRRENFTDGFTTDGLKVQFSFKYNFSWKVGG